MYEEADIDAGVRAGLLTATSAVALRKLTAKRRSADAISNERFGHVEGRSNVITAVAVGLSAGISSLFLIFMFMGSPYAALSLIPILGCAERFTRKQQLKLTSFVLFVNFAVAWAVTCFGLALLLPFGPASTNPQAQNVIAPLHGLVTAGGTALGCALYFKRYRLPVAYAAAAVAALNFVVHLLRIVTPDASALAVSLVLLLAGVALFVLALRWDRQDNGKKTLRTDVAFWLHAAAGFQIAGACFRLIVGVTGEPTGWDRLYSFTLNEFSATSAALLLIFAILFSGLSLAINRPPLLTSSVAFVLPALAFLAGGGGLGWLTSLIVEVMIGLLLSASWPTMRRAFLAWLPVNIRAKLNAFGQCAR